METYKGFIIETYGNVDKKKFGFTIKRENGKPIFKDDTIEYYEYHDGTTPDGIPLQSESNALNNAKKYIDIWERLKLYPFQN